MKPALKVGVVAAGYVAAILVAAAMVAIRVVYLSGPDADASSGMYAFGDTLLFVAVFSVAAIAPTGMALFFLRSYRRFWLVLSSVALGVAVTGLVAATVFEVERHGKPVPMATLAIFSVLRILAAPPLALTFIAPAILSPFRFPRFAFIAAMLMEAAVTAYAGYIWFIPLFFDALERR